MSGGTGSGGRGRRRQPASLRLARLIRRALLPAAVVCGVLMWRSFGTLRVPAGMDTMPEFPPGTLCVIEKRPSEVRPGQAVFVAIRDGTVLSRVVAVRDGQVLVRHDAEDSMLPDSDEVGPVSIDAVRAVVLTGFAPEDGETPVTGGGR